LFALAVLAACQHDVAEAAVAAEVAPVAKPPAATRPPPEPTLSFEEVVVGAEADARLPLVIAIHGLGDRPERFVRLFDGFDVPARIVAPRAPRERKSGGFTWFPGLPADRDLTPLVDGARDSAAALAELITYLRANRPTCGQPLVTGFSQGGLLTLTLAVHHPEVVGAAIPVGGWLPPPMWPKEKTSPAPEIDALHGERDSLVPLTRTKTANEHLKALGYDIETRTYPTGHTISKNMRRDLFMLVREAIADVGRCD